MQSSIIALFAVIITSAVAAPTPMPIAVPTAILTNMPSLNDSTSALNCDAAACAIALGGTAVGCVAAAIEVVANPIVDIGCLAGAINVAVNAPATCKTCSQKLGLGGTVNAATSAVGGVFDGATSVIGHFF